MPAEKKKLKSKRGEENLTVQQRQLVDEYYSTIAQMNFAKNNFQYVTDPELISASVYEINSLQERYAYLLGRIKAEEISFLKVLR